MTNVLVVEDDQSIAELVCDVLEEARYTLAVARDGVAALQRLQQQRPDLMLLDLRMPRMGGAALLHACDSPVSERPSTSSPHQTA